MKFLIINGSLQKDGSGKLITVSDTYNNEPMELDGHILKTGGGLIGDKWKPLPKLDSVTEESITGNVYTVRPPENAEKIKVFADGTLIGEVNR